VSSRAKQVNRLENKLKERVIKLNRKYSAPEDILEDIVDLAGVRIALYFPNDAEKVGGIIAESFDLVERKSYPEPQNYVFPTRRVASERSTIIDNASAQDSSRSREEVGIGQRWDQRASHTFQPRFVGYVADHYRVRIRRQDLNTSKHKENFKGIEPMPMIEIQVASVLMHAVITNFHHLMLSN
jgi:ppGpp synthetase/RelA/SpoT-type nucleotidyltranferase